MIGIIDYGMGNLSSVQKALESLKASTIITADKEELEKCHGLILPGVGAFPDAMKNIKNNELDQFIKDYSFSGKPFLGICLGMQLLFDIGYEVEPTEGLGLIRGKIKKLEIDYKIPHMGWNSLDIKRECKLIQGVENGSYVYFVHSYYAEVENEANLAATADYGIDVPAVVQNGNVFGAQFHPEKSGDVGMLMLKNFIDMISK
ncbi:imidazole glycerol phosphate synthase subunit HisH [Clostridium sp. 19966]|uniref:imidazole glycerol phosphate synthase subunit HisH n=1 Tax=Clostridium sp. 19966 TaxID=2768166 RepID=UPI0028E02F8B|nr:imidazole glycerol phosphate synthase subunit HisH [Clostridium sp. 19966]MDT8715506.1 imidazole glycerol phosphate synthase subunit HisH [Clostridium sp. 19966]